MRSDGKHKAPMEELPVTELQLSGKELGELMRIKLQSGLPFRFQARGWSMAPFIRDHDVITLRALAGIKIQVGDIVAFIRPESENLVVHRVIARQGESFLIQGDGAEGMSDGIIPSSNLIGIVTEIERNGRGIWLGLGLERYPIAWLSRAHLIQPIRIRLVRWRNRILPRPQ